MLTTPHLHQLWVNARYRRLLEELLAGRVEDQIGLAQRVWGALPAAAIGLLHLGERRQGRFSLGQALLDYQLLRQRRDGSWGEGRSCTITTALCIRGLVTASGLECADRAVLPVRHPPLGLSQFEADRPAALVARHAIDRGIAFLAGAQQSHGGWEDGYTTAAVLLELGRIEAFRGAIKLGAALEWRHAPAQSQQERLAWSHVALRCGRVLRVTAMQQGKAHGKHRLLPLFANVA